MSSEWVMVYSTNQIHHCEMVKQFLEDNDIHAMSIDKRDSSYLFGEIELYVNRDEVLKSKLLIEKFENL
jgi:hypothetical protein